MTSLWSNNISNPTDTTTQNYRGTVMTKYLISGIHISHFRLLLSMVVGFFQSRIPFTPGNIGNSFLRPMYLDVHNFMEGVIPNTKQACCCAMDLTITSKLSLQWWINALKFGLNKQCQPTNVFTIGVTRGYCSGTGPGENINLVIITRKFWCHHHWCVEGSLGTPSLHFQFKLERSTYFVMYIGKWTRTWGWACEGTPAIILLISWYYMISSELDLVNISSFGLYSFKLNFLNLLWNASLKSSIHLVILC